jgi:hypothetical protein
MSLAVSMKRDGIPTSCSIFHERYEGSIGRQCPPTPGPGRNGMNPNGFVAAARTTSQMSTPRAAAWIVSSLTSATLT